MTPIPRSRLLLFVVLFSMISVPAPPSPARPDVVLLCVDGLGFSSTPALAALRRRSRVFERAYLPHPVAAVSRAALFTGRRPENSRIWAAAEERPEGAVLLAEAFARGGYATARVGRTTGGALEDQIHWDRSVPPTTTAGSGEAAATLLSESRDRPLFLVAGFDDLGPPVALAADAGKVPGIERPAIAMGDLPFGARPGRRQEVAAASEAARREVHRAQEARARVFDAQLARILDALDRQRRWENTVVVLVGMEAPVSGELAAGTRPDVLFEDSLRVPLFVAVPGLKAPGTATSTFVDTTDVYATVLDLAGLGAVPDTDGRSLVRALRDPSAAVRNAAASVTQRDAGHLGRSVRTARWRFTEWPEGSLELYDHDTDPHEYTNLAAHPAYEKTVREMKALIGKAARPPKPNAAAVSPLRHPNVLLIILDDATMHLGTYGYPAKTPHIDRLAQLGRRFDRAYAQVAICSPSRTALLSGWQPERSDIWDNIHMPRQSGMVPLEDHFAHHGYFTAQIGKVWESRFAKYFHWDVSEYFPALTAEQAAPPTAAQRRAWRAEAAEAGDSGGRDPNDITSYWKKTDNKDEDEADGRRARRVAQLLEEHRDRPFFIALGFGKPHLRWSVPRHYFDLYDPAKIELPPNPPHDDADIPEIALEAEVAHPRRFYVGREDNVARDSERQAIAAYYSTISFVDAQLGIVLDALDRQHLWDDTIVVFTSDHGFHLGEHRGDMWRKDTLFEEALHVPLIVAAPGLTGPGVPAPAPVELLDLYPTLVELAGLPAVNGVDGRSLVPVLKDPKAEVRVAAESWRRVQAPTVAVSVRSGKWRYNEWPDGTEELFDLDKDPQQRENVADTAPAALAELRARRAELVP